MSHKLSQLYCNALPQTRALLRDFGRSFQPISMAASAETGAFLAALLETLSPDMVIESGSGFTSAVLRRGIHVEDNAEYQVRVEAWLKAREIPVGAFISYESLHQIDFDGLLFVFLHGNLSTRPVTAAWLRRRLSRAVLLIDDAQPGTFRRYGHSWRN